MLKKLFLALGFALLLLFCTAGSTANNSSNVLILTDVHFDPFSSCGESVTFQSQQCLLNLINESNPALWSFPSGSVNSYSQDTNNTFLINGLRGLDQYINSNQISKVFLNGDLLSHDFRVHFDHYLPNGTQAQLTNLALNTLAYVIYNVAQATHNARIYYVLGNNDTDTFDYMYPTQDFMQRITPMISKYMADTAAFSRTFGSGGYSNMSLNNNVTVIGLNFNLLTQQDSVSESSVALANKQLAWLKQQLATARLHHKKVIILQHEPFGIDTYKAATGTSPTNKYYMVLNTILQHKYLETYSRNSDIINNYYYGHFHMDSIQVAANLFAFSTLAFNVDFGNNPGFKIVNLNQLGQLQDYTTYYSNFSNNSLSWQKLYSLNETYNILPGNYVNYFINFPGDKNLPVVSSYINYYNGYNMVESLLQPISLPGRWPYYHCGMMNMESLNYYSCIRSI